VGRANLKNAFYRVGGTGDEFMEPRGRWPEKVLEPLVYTNTSAYVKLILKNKNISNSKSP
jgi:hypothetical protein